MIAIEYQAAFGAAMSPLRKRLLNPCPTARAVLRRVPGIHPNHETTGTCSLVVQHVEEDAPARVVDALGQFGASETLNVQVFNSNDREAVSQIVAQLVQEVGSLVGDVRVNARQFAVRLPLSPRTLLSTRGFAVRTTQLHFHVPVVLRRGNRFPGGKRDERLQTDIDADRSAWMLWRCSLGDLQHEAGVPLTSPALDHDTLDPRFGGDRTVPDDLDLSDSLDTESVILQGRPVAEGEVRAIEAVATLEARVAGSLAGLDASKEGSKRLVEPPEDMLRCGVVKGSKPFIFGSQSLQNPGRLRVVGQRLLPLLVGIPPFRKRGIIESAIGIQHRVERLLLSAVRIEPIVPTRKHYTIRRRSLV